MSDEAEAETNPPPGFGLDDLVGVMRQIGCTKLYAKNLSKNDDGKRQIYLASGFNTVNILRPTEFVEKRSDKGQTIQAKLTFNWIDAEGRFAAAPHAKLILYPDYPEVRLSGLVLGSALAPSLLLREAAGLHFTNRVLFLGVTDSDRVFAIMAWGEHRLVRELAERTGDRELGVLTQIDIPALDAGRTKLLAELKRVHEKGWIAATVLKLRGGVPEPESCRGTNCGGYTLEAEFGIPANGSPEPDFHGWEIKQHGIRQPVVTLFTPQPEEGVYHDEGVEVFVRRFGYEDTRGRPDRLNFGGVYRVGEEHSRTLLTLRLDGYDADARKMTNTSGGIELVNRDGEVAARWPFTGFLNKWKTKHAKAAYVRSENRPRDAGYQYRYLKDVTLMEGTDPLLVLASLAAGLLYYDPGIKVEKATTSDPSCKHRNQFRMKYTNLDQLYLRGEAVDVTTV